MKKRLLVLLVVCMGISLITCTSTDNISSIANNDIPLSVNINFGGELKAKVIEYKDDYLLVAGMDDKSEGLYTVPTNKNIPDDLKNGSIINIGYDGIIQESYPAKLPSIEYIEILEQGDDIVGLYRTVFNDLFEVDNALNSDIDIIIALDLTKVENLSQTEKDALAYILWNDIGVVVQLSTYDDLLAGGLITYPDEDSKFTQFENGTLFTFETTEIKENSFEFSAKKWKSSLGAYSFADCVAKKKNGSWTYEIGSEFIS